MSWNYRAVDLGTHLAVYEVYYNEAGAVTGWSDDPVTLTGLTLDDLTLSLERALKDLRTRPTLRVR